MDLIEVVICQLWSFVSDHFLRFAFEAHALATSATEHLAATINFYHRHATICIGTFSYSVFSHVADKICISLSDLYSLIAGIARMSNFLTAVAVYKFACGTGPDQSVDDVDFSASSSVAEGHLVTVISDVLVQSHSLKSLPLSLVKNQV